jgi:cytochrome c oxidase subunit 2
MEVHRFEKLWLVVSLLLIAGWIATVVYGAVGPGVAMVGDNDVQVDASDPTASEQFREPGVYCNDAKTECDVYIIAQQFVFRPDPVTVPAGSTVTFHVTSADVVHGFQVVGTNVNLMVVPGQATVATVEFDDPAEYGVVCNEYCGSGHHTMAAELNVVPAAQYNGTAGDAA